MAYNHGCENRKWHIWKESEEKVLGRLQYWLMVVRKNEDAILERLAQGSQKQRCQRTPVMKKTEKDTETQA